MSSLFVAEAMMHGLLLVFEATVTAGATPTPRREGRCDDATDNVARVDVDVGVRKDVGAFAVAVGCGGVNVSVAVVAVFGFNAEEFEVRT